MFEFFANIFGYVLNFIYNFVGNYGLAIIIFTVLLKLLMLPMSIKQQKTMKKSSKIQAEVKVLQEKYQNDPVRLNQEMMDLYKEENMSPFSGCLSSILQMIVLISIFFLVSRPLTFMLHVDNDVISQYETEIQENSEGKTNYQEIAVIREKGGEDERVNINMNFLGLDLSAVPSQNFSDWKVFVIPVLYVLTSIVSMKITTAMQSAKKKEKEKPEEKKSEEEDAMADMNKTMMYMMPIMSVSIALIAPLGLALYWLVNNLLMIMERLVINKVCKDA
jgi:YidC/Oxa1 family membrane protein insertase